jgi:hypothetical protein
MGNICSNQAINKNSLPTRPIITIGSQSVIIIDKAIIEKLDTSWVFSQELTNDGVIVLTPVKSDLMSPELGSQQLGKSRREGGQ